MSFTNNIWNIYRSIVEAKIPDLSLYQDPPPRAKFQKNDIVIIRDDGRYASYHQKICLPYVNKVGVVQSYRNVPGGYSKFALKFNDGMILPIHSHFLYGPFASMSIALKYEDPTVPIDIKDLSIRGKVLENWQTMPLIEQRAREILTQAPYNFTWYSTPVQSTSGPNIIFELARNGPFSFTRTNKLQSKKLSSEIKNGSRVHKGYALTLPFDCQRDSLFLTYRYPSSCFQCGDMKTFKQSLVEPYTESIGDLNNPLIIQGYVKNFAIYEILKAKQTLEWTEEEFLQIMGDNIIPTSDGMYELVVPRGPSSFTSFSYNPHTFNKCKALFDKLIVDGNVILTAMITGHYSGVAQEFSLLNTPRKIIGDLIVSSSSNCASLEGAPMEITGRFVSNNFTDADYRQYVQTSIAKDTYKGGDLSDLIDF